MAGICDLVAAKGKYHLQCYSSFLRNYDTDTNEAMELESTQAECFKQHWRRNIFPSISLGEICRHG